MLNEDAKEISEIAKVDLEEIVGVSYESFLDILCESIGYPLLEDIEYNVEGHEGDTLLIRVRGFDNNFMQEGI